MGASDVGLDIRTAEDSVIATAVSNDSVARTLEGNSNDSLVGACNANADWSAAVEKHLLLSFGFALDQA